MTFASQEALARHYAELLARHGGGPRAVGYGSAHGQLIGFGQMARTDGLAAGARVLDVGCGLGALKDYLDARGLPVDYTGWDICGPLVTEARRLHPGATFEERDILRDPPGERFDFVFSCGALSLELPDHDAWMRAMIDAMWAAAGRALVFTLLGPRHGAGDGRYHLADPAAVLAHCLTLGGQVLLDHAEVSHGFAVYVYRHNPAPVERLRAILPPSGGYGDAERAVVEHYRSLGLLAEAQAFVASLPESADGCDAAALLCCEAGDDARMVAALGRAAELEPTRALRWRRLATALARAGRRAEALAALDRAAALPEDSQGRRWTALLREALGGR